MTWPRRTECHSCGVHHVGAPHLCDRCGVLDYERETKRMQAQDNLELRALRAAWKTKARRVPGRLEGAPKMTFTEERRAADLAWYKAEWARWRRGD